MSNTVSLTILSDSKEGEENVQKENTLPMEEENNEQHDNK